MVEKNLGRRLLLILGILAFSVALFVFKKDPLKGGLDIAGGVSMIFEIDDTGLPEWEKANLAETMKGLLQRRVDPQGVYGLAWRAIGQNRLEVQMPLAGTEVNALRERYSTLQKELFAGNLRRSEIEAAFAKSGAARESEFQRLAGGVSERPLLLTKAAAAYDAYQAALEARNRGPTSVPAAEGATTAPATVTADDLESAYRDAEEDLQDALDRALETNFNSTQFTSALELERDSPMRKRSLEQIKSRHANLKEKIDQVVAAYDAWRGKRGRLDGPADLRRLLRGAGVLEFRILAAPDPANPTRFERYRQQLKEFGPRPRPGDAEGWFKLDNPTAFFSLKSPAELAGFDPRSAAWWVVDKYGEDFYVLAKLGEADGLLSRSKTKWQLRGARPGRDEHGRLSVEFWFDTPGGAQFGRLTENNINNQLCILLDDVAYSSARIISKIRDNGQITGDFSPDKVQYLVQTMQAGALPARLKDTPLSERVIEARLGAENLGAALKAGIIGLIVVAGFMAVYYLVGGLIANAALLLNILFVLSAMAMLDARFTLDGIAGVILTIGMSVDANVLIFERMREEKERGASLRVMIKNGYDKAFGTIFDSNVTTLLTSIILYYLGSEEVRGFGLTLGWGIVISMFTSLFVTRTIFGVLIKYNLITDLKMLKVIGVPNVDWYRWRKFFIPMSLVLTISGFLSLFVRSPQKMLDVEFLGGVSATIELTQASNGGKIEDALRGAVASIRNAGGQLASATVSEEPGQPGDFRVTVPGVEKRLLAAIIAEPVEPLLQRDGVNDRVSGEGVVLRTKGEATAERIKSIITGLNVDQAADNIARATVNRVIEDDDPGKKDRFFNVVTTETNRRLVQHALVSALGDTLKVQQRVGYVFHGEDDRPYPIVEKRLEANIPGLPATAGGDVTDYLGGAAMYFSNLNPPQKLADLKARLTTMRLQPGYEDYPWREFDVIGVTPAGGDLFSGVVVVVADPTYAYSLDAQRWASELAVKELDLARAALDTEQSLQKVTQFKPQIASQAAQRAILALVFSWLMIIGYVWLRFGTAVYGVAGVVALVHDVLVALAFVAISSFIGGGEHAIGSALLIEDFRINMPVIAALLTIIGFSINDTIVIFDRIRETRGRLGIVTPEIINRSVNQCMSRTILTSTTVFFVLLSMYIFGGSSIRGFNYCMLVGVLVGTYSTFAVAAPLLLLGKKADTSVATV
ncbi:MAG: hypothetical protein CHACPFDD_02679 [Phycisphaerae bacterium]|nr:hypothetical protein [Phycisphaerae bacterium]